MKSPIEVYDNLIPFTRRSDFYVFAKKSKFQIGWLDSEEYDKQAYPCLHSDFSLEDLKHMGILPFIKEAFQKSQYKKFYDEKIVNIKLNLSKPGDIYYHHAHGKDFCVALYYINLDWKTEWAGETLFWDKFQKNIIFTSPYVPGRIVLFGGGVPHSIRPQTFLGPSFRFTLSIFFQRHNDA